MDIGIITLHAVLNFGSALQVYATSKVLTEMGHTVKVIDYWRPLDHLAQYLFRIVKAPEKTITHKVLSVGYKSIELVVTRKLFKQFYRENVCLTKRYNTYEKLLADPPGVDACISGSDQIWNSLHNFRIEKAYYLDFVPTKCKRIAYAASFGVDALPEGEVEDVARLVGGFDAISVREDTAIDILAQLGRNDVCHVLDPTMLLTKEEWGTFAESFQHKDPYLLVYTVEEKASIVAMACAKSIAKKRNLKIYHVTAGGFRQAVPGSDKEFLFKTPRFFLGAMLNAEFIVASSFHGTAFALNFEKQFISVMPDRFSVRAKSILRMMGVEERAVSSEEEAARITEQDIDYSVVGQKLAAERTKSRRFLADALDGPNRR